MVNSFAPAKTVLPKWYKDLPKFVNGKPAFSPERTVAARSCVPFLESLTAGYVITLPGDVIVEMRNSKPFFSWGAAKELLSGRNPLFAAGLPTPDGYLPDHLIWKTNVAISIPKGYSALFTHPLNRFDLPFLTLSGVVDGFVMSSGSVPFFLRKGFEGTIPQGTPILQIIPFKTEDWESKEDSTLLQIAEENSIKSFAVTHGWYKNSVWKKKLYN
jgi:hypothetical protein